MSNISRRKFLYAGVGVAAAAGIGYLTKDYWLPKQEQILTPSPTSTPIITESPQPTVTQTLTSTQTTSTPIETTAATEEMSEDEIMIKELFDNFVEAYNNQNMKGVLDCYTEDARIVTLKGKYNYKGPREMKYHFDWNFNHNSRMYDYRIIELDISDDTAKALSYYSIRFDFGATTGQTKYDLVKIKEIKRGRSTFKLDKPLWKISREEVYHIGERETD